MISANTIVGSRYRVVKALGGGGMKLVYLAEDLRLAARPCALAEMVDSITNPQMQSQAVASFQREADMLAELNNEHIPRIYDRFNEQNRHYLVMEFIDGVTLEQALRAAGGKLEQDRLLEIALQILDTLDYLHNLVPPVVYRDLKPSNVMLTPGGLVKLIDFGIARHFQPLSNATMIGTQGYAPPEQYRGKVEIRSDLYALGATIHHALTGRDPTSEPPFSFPPLRKVIPDVNPALAEVVDHALAYDVENRISSASEFKRRLLAIKLGSSTATAPPSDASQSATNAVVQQQKTQGKPQLNLPLGSPRAGASPSAPTRMAASVGFVCPDCGRKIPANSRFCSYCAADLRQVLQAGDVVNVSEAETFILPEPDDPAAVPSDGAHVRRGPERRRRSRFPLFAILAIFIAAFAFTLVTLGVSGYRASVRPEGIIAPPGYSTEPEAEEPPSRPGLVPPESAEPQHTSPRSIMLRRTLDMQGYRQVHFRLGGQNIELWGTVPSEADRLMVETMAFSISGAISLSDHIQVRNSFAGP